MSSYVSPELREQFETLPIDLKNKILEQSVHLDNIHDLLDVLDAIAKEDQGS